MEGSYSIMQKTIPVKKRLRFKEEDDIALLREVAGQNPFENPNLWNVIQENILLLTGKNFMLKTLKDHLDLLLKLWLEKINILKDKSGIEEDYSEKDQLCQNIHDYMINFRGKIPSKKQKLDNLGKKDRDLWANKFETQNNVINDDSLMETCTENIVAFPLDHEYCSGLMEEVVQTTSTNEGIPSDFTVNITHTLQDTSTKSKDSSPLKENIENASQSTPMKAQDSKVLRPNKARRRKLNIQRQGLLYLEEYDKRQQEIKIKEQQLEEKRVLIEEKKLVLETNKLQLAEQKFILEEFERKKQIEILEQKLIHENEQRKELTKIIERQDKIINFLLSGNTSV